MPYRSKFIISFAIFVFLFSAGFVLAAWRDAPAGPPSYGAVSPDTQDDYKPMNLGSATQDKSGVIGATGFRDSDDANYFLDLNSGIMAGVIAGSVGIGQTVPSAKLTINNPSTDGKIGSSGDAIYAYANSSNAAISAEQNGSGYAIYSSGGMNYFSGNVGIGMTDPKASLHVRGSSILGFDATDQVVVIGAASKAFPKTDGTSNDWSANGAFWAMPMIYRSQRWPDTGGGAFPDNEYGELMLQGTSHGGSYNKGISFITWDGTAADPTIRMRIKENGNVEINTAGFFGTHLIQVHAAYFPLIVEKP